MARKLAAGIGVAVAERTFLRQDKYGNFESWPDVAKRVAVGNCLLHKTGENDRRQLERLISEGVVLMSGRHLSRGDENQKYKTAESFTNCAMSATSTMLFYLLLCGSGVGRCYDDNLCIIDWSFCPHIEVVISNKHPDYNDSFLATEEMCINSNTHVFYVGDSREGWVKSVEYLETEAYLRSKGEQRKKSVTFVFDAVRERGRPINGLEGRPASGPIPLMEAFLEIESVRKMSLPKWELNMRVSHALAKCVVVGGIRRSSMLACKYWKEPDILRFISLKDNENLWTANNSVLVDKEFWDLLDTGDEQCEKIFDKAMRSAYYMNTGEPAFINVDKLVQEKGGSESFADGLITGTDNYTPSDSLQKIYSDLLKASLNRKYTCSVNPCSEIVLNNLLGFCVLGDVAPYHAKDFYDIELAIRLTVRSLIRVNLMNSVYKKEVDRTNRIGVSLTGIHEFMWDRFGYSFRDVLDENKTKDFWLYLSRLKGIVKNEAAEYSKELDLIVPHTETTIKPSGSVSKLFSITEGAHLPAMPFYLRWVQFRYDSHLVSVYREKGYPVRNISEPKDTVIVGFPTKIELADLGLGDNLVTAKDASIEEQYKWIGLLEKYWLIGVDSYGLPLDDTSNQIAYTLKFDPSDIPFDDFKALIKKHQRTIKCCSLLPQVNKLAYEYQPEEMITQEEYDRLMSKIGQVEKEMVELDHIGCSNGACPIDFK